MRALTANERMDLGLRAIRHTPPVWSRISNAMGRAIDKVELDFRNRHDVRTPRVRVTLPVKIAVLARAHLQYLALGRAYRTVVGDNAPVRIDWALVELQLSDQGALVLMLKGTYVRDAW